MCAAGHPPPQPPTFPGQTHTFTHEAYVGLSFDLTQRNQPLPQAADLWGGVLTRFSSLVDSPGLVLQLTPHPSFSPGPRIQGRVFIQPLGVGVHLKMHFSGARITNLQKYCFLLRNPSLH